MPDKWRTPLGEEPENAEELLEEAGRLVGQDLRTTFPNASVTLAFNAEGDPFLLLSGGRMPNADMDMCGRPAVRQHGCCHRIGAGLRNVRPLPDAVAGVPCASFGIALAASRGPRRVGRLDLRRGERHRRCHRGTGCGESRRQTRRTERVTKPMTHA